MTVSTNCPHGDDGIIGKGEEDSSRSEEDIVGLTIGETGVD
jgi:hypothetical protein